MTVQKSRIQTKDAATGAERAAMVLLALGEQHGAPLWSEFDDAEISAITAAMARLGTVDPEIAVAAMTEFNGALQGGTGLVGTLASTEKLLVRVLPEERAASVLDSLRRPGGPDIWEKLTTLKDQVLADYLSGEYPQTAAVILSKLPPSHAAQVLGRLPPEFALACLERVMQLESIDRDMLRSIENALGESLIATTTTVVREDPALKIADMFTALDRQTSNTLLGLWRENDAETSAKIRGMMFTFEDFTKLDAAAGQTIMRVVDKDILAVSLKGAAPEIRNFFLEQMSARASRLFEDQILQTGPMRLRDVESAQAKIIALAKDLASCGEITLFAPTAIDSTEEMVD